VRHALKPETIGQVDRLDWESANLQLLASFEVRRNRGMRHLRATVTALLRQEGKQVEILKPSIKPTAAKAIEQQLKASRNSILLTQAKSVATAKALTAVEATSLEQKSRNQALSIDELNALERFYIAQFYRLEQVPIEQVMLDRQGQTRREVRHLELVLNGSIAIAKTAGSIDQNATTPQDWSKAAVQHQLLELSGARQLIRELAGGAVVELDPERVAPIAAYLQAHPQEFQLAFGFSNIHKVAPMQAITTVLNWCGIKRSVHRRRIPGRVLRIYRIDQEHLRFLQTLLAQRGEIDPTLLLNDQLTGVGSNPQPEILPPKPPIDEDLIVLDRPISRSYIPIPAR
jgi:hypothetical protein